MTILDTLSAPFKTVRFYFEAAAFLLLGFLAFFLVHSYDVAVTSSAALSAQNKALQAVSQSKIDDLATQLRDQSAATAELSSKLDKLNELTIQAHEHDQLLATSIASYSAALAAQGKSDPTVGAWNSAPLPAYVLDWVQAGVDQAPPRQPSSDGKAGLPVPGGQLPATDPGTGQVPGSHESRLRKPVQGL